MIFGSERSKKRKKRKVKSAKSCCLGLYSSILLYSFIIANGTYFLLIKL